MILGGTGNVYAEDFDYPKTILLGATYDINWDEWLDLYNYVGYDVSSGGIIEVSEDLIVTGIKPGIEYLTIYYEDDYGSYQDVYKITVKATDGVYRIKNTNTGKYLELSNSIVKGDIPVICDESSICMEQLWRLENIGDDYVKIRPYIDKNALLMYAADREAIIVTESKALYSPQYEDNSAMKWRLSQGSNSLWSGSTTMGYNSEKGVYAGSTYPDYLWELEPVTEADEEIRICDVYNNHAGSVEKRYISKSSTKNLNDLKIKVLEYSIEDNNSPLVWSSSNSSVATVDINSGTVTGITPGITIITCTKTINDVVYRQSYTLEVKSFEDGIYSLGGYGNSSYIATAPENEIDYRVRLCSPGTNDNGNNRLLVYLMLDIDGYYQMSVAATENNNILSTAKNNLGIASSDMSSPITLYKIEEIDKESLKFWIEENQEYNGYYNIYPQKSQSGTDALMSYAGNGYIYAGEVDKEDYDFLWGISPIVSSYNLELNLRPIYDEAFLAEFNNSKIEMETFLDESIDELEEVFDNEFGLSIVCDEYVPFELIDGNNNNSVGEIYYEWLEYYNFENLTDYTNDDMVFSNKNVIIFFSGNEENGGSETTDTYVLINVNLDFNEEDTINKFKFDLLHEMGHAVGSLHHYHSGNPCGNLDRCSRCAEYGKRRDRSCVMNFNDYDNNDPFCDDCTKEVMIHLHNHHVKYQ